VQPLWAERNKKQFDDLSGSGWPDWFAGSLDHPSRRLGSSLATILVADLRGSLP
jgi:hypothetical protein